MTEAEKMKQGLWYDANFDKELVEQRLAAEELCFQLNQTRPRDADKRAAILQKLIPDLGENCAILSPFVTDYGCYCRIGHDTFLNHNAYLMDGGGITIGHHCFIGPNFGAYTAIHPMLAEERNTGLEKALPIVIGDNCWIGADVTVLPGVTIGSHCVIGAKSVVTRDILDHTLALGNPCRVIRSITESDSIHWNEQNWEAIKWDCSKKKKHQERTPEPEKKSPLDEIDPSIRPGGVFMVQLLMKDKCETPSLERMTEVLSRRIGRVEAAHPTEDAAGSMKDIALFAALDHIAKFSNGEAPVQVSVMPCDTFHPETIDEMKRSQMWDCLQDRDRILSECKYCVFANDMLSGALDPLERADFDMDYLEALVELFPTCEAVYSLNTGKLVLADTIRSRTYTGLDRFIHYIVNARFFNIQDTDGHVVDTLGMSLLYIEDLQYIFHEMDPNWVVRHAYSIASYCLANRRPIKDGDTVDGIAAGGNLDQSIQWKCRFEDTLVGPGRPALGIHMDETV